MPYHRWHFARDHIRIHTPSILRGAGNGGKAPGDVETRVAAIVDACAAARVAAVDLHDRRFVLRLQWIFGTYRSAIVSAYARAHANASPSLPFDHALVLSLERMLRIIVAVRERHAP